jgi:hypothetical protein
VNADDFGLSRQVNEAILKAFEKGLISSATIMTNMPAFEEASQLARQNNLQRRIGLHLNFTEGKPLTAEIATCPRFCDTDGFWLPRRKVFTLSDKEKLVLEAEIAAQIMACGREGITPTHLDSHHYMHCEFGIAPAVIRMAKHLGIGGIRLAPNCGTGRAGATWAHRMLARAYWHAQNTRLRLNGLARTEYFGDARDTAHILQTTTADVEVMVHPMLDDCGRLVDFNGEDLASRITALSIPADEMCSYYGL